MDLLDAILASLIQRTNHSTAGKALLPDDATNTAENLIKIILADLYRGL